MKSIKQIRDEYVKEASKNTRIMNDMDLARSNERLKVLLWILED